MYVDAATGSDANDGTTLAAPFASIRQAVSLATSSTAIYVANGTYTNNNYGLGRLNNGAALTISHVDNILLSALPGHAPKIAFDGSGGIVVETVRHLTISGFEIEGANRDITHEEAAADRLLHSARFSGRGIYIRRSQHVLVQGNVVHHCGNAGIRSNVGDYITVEDNVVYNCTWWSSNAESAIVFAESTAIDTLVSARTQCFSPLSRSQQEHAGPTGGTPARGFARKQSGRASPRLQSRAARDGLWLVAMLTPCTARHRLGRTS